MGKGWHLISSAVFYHKIHPLAMFCGLFFSYKGITMTETNKECHCDLIDWTALAAYLENKTISGVAESRPIQRRRGSADEHAGFIGLDGEITVDTTNKTLRVHDGETPGGTLLAKLSDITENIPNIEFPPAFTEFLAQLDNMDYVVEAQKTGTTWYRKYKSGWVEQGGFNANATGPVVITLPVKMADTSYGITLVRYGAAQAGIPTIDDTSPITVNGFRITNSNAGNSSRAHWMVTGFSEV